VFVKNEQTPSPLGDLLLTAKCSPALTDILKDSSCLSPLALSVDHRGIATRVGERALAVTWRKTKDTADGICSCCIRRQWRNVWRRTYQRSAQQQQQQIYGQLSECWCRAQWPRSNNSGTVVSSLLSSFVLSRACSFRSASSRVVGDCWWSCRLSIVHRLFVFASPMLDETPVRRLQRLPAGYCTYR